VIGAAFWLVPQFGLMRTAGVCALLNLACAVAALLLSAPVEPRERSARASGSGVLLLLAATGLLGIGYEVLVVRALSQIAENTVYTFAILLAVYLIGTTLGAAIYARWLVNRYDAILLRDRLLQMLAAVCLLGTLLFSLADILEARILDSLDPSMGNALGAETLLAGMVFLLPTMLMGALFSHLSTSARADGVAFGRALGINTLGAALSPLLFSVLLVPLLGLKLVLLLVAAGYLALASRKQWTRPVQLVVATATLACIVWAPSLQMVTVPAGGRLVAHLNGVMASVSVVEDSRGVATLHIDNRQQEGSTATLLADARQGLLPILLHPGPRAALFLGVGTGLTASAATLDPLLQVDAVELVPEVITATTHFAEAAPSAADASRLHLMSADARRFVRTAPQSYDVIVADNFHPARSGTGSLYSVEHFALIRNRLAAAGIFCQWLPLHQLDLDTLRSIVHSFMAVYPSGAALLATNSLDTPVVGLIARRDGKRFDLEQVRARLKRAPSPTLEEFGIADELALLGSFVAGPRALARFAADAPLNTDDRPIVAYRAPRITYAPDSSPRDRMIEILHELAVDPAEILSEPVASDGSVRLRAYWTARNRFIEAGRDVRPTADVRDMLSQVREPLLTVLRISPDFRPAYDPLLRMATALSSVDLDGARSLLGELQHVQPLRPEAGQLLREHSEARP
jgi:spermidine synthase